MTPDLPFATWALIRHDYERTDRPVEEICAEHGIASSTLRDRMRRWEWKRRRTPIPDEGPPLPPLPPAPDAAPNAAFVAAPVFVVPESEALPAAPQNGNAPPAIPAPHAMAADAGAPAEIAQRLQGAVARVLPAIEATLGRLAAGTTHPRETERAARTLTALTRTLRELNTLLGAYQAAAAAAEGPDNLDEFRADLARKIDAIIARRPKNNGEASWPGDPDDANNDASGAGTLPPALRR